MRTSDPVSARPVSVLISHEDLECGIRTQTYTVDTSAVNAVFDGVGAISGGGGETVLLPAYPVAQQQEILDFLFKPSFGAALSWFYTYSELSYMFRDTGSETFSIHTAGRRTGKIF